MENGNGTAKVDQVKLLRDVQAKLSQAWSMIYEKAEKGSFSNDFNELQNEINVLESKCFEIINRILRSSR